jgi:sRNA-binding protein
MKREKNMVYKSSRRQENEEVIRMLADRYPKCFFEEPKLRRPLKLDIISDLQKEKAFLDNELIASGVEWYQSHLAYLHSLAAGAKRLDLNGREVSTVTEPEYIAAQAKIKLAHQKLNANAAGTLQALHAAGRIPDDQVRKLDAPMSKTAKTTIAPELTRLHEAVMAASTTLATQDDPGLRAAMAAAALKVVCQEAQCVIDKLNVGSE